MPTGTAIVHWIGCNNAIKHNTDWDKAGVQPCHIVSEKKSGPNRINWVSVPVAILETLM